jgi:hypothetical protein
MSEILVSGIQKINLDAFLIVVAPTFGLILRDALIQGNYYNSFLIIGLNLFNY